MLAHRLAIQILTTVISFSLHVEIAPLAPSGLNRTVSIKMGSADAESKGGGGSSSGGGGGEQYCLRWNDFQANVTGALSDIRDGEEFLDVTLVSDGREIRAHKLVLSSCSPLFRQMLKRSSAHPSPMVFLHGIRFADLSAILNFMYHGEVNVGQDELSTFLAAAEELRIRGLSEKTPEQMAAVKSQLAQSPSAAATSSKKMVAAEEGGKESSSRIPTFPKNSPSIPQVIIDLIVFLRQSMVMH